MVFRTFLGLQILCVTTDSCVRELMWEQHRTLYSCHTTPLRYIRELRLRMHSARLDLDTGSSDRIIVVLYSPQASVGMKKLRKFLEYYPPSPLKNHSLCICVFFPLNRSFYPSTSSTTRVRADSSIVEETQVLWSQIYTAEILRCHVWHCSKHSDGQLNAMSY